MQPKYIFVTGGVVSSLGKGLASASMGSLLEARGLRVNFLKFDPYLNVHMVLVPITVTDPYDRIFGGKGGNLLRDAFVEDLEVAPLQPGHDAVVRVGDGDRHQHHMHVHLDGGCPYGIIFELNDSLLRGLAGGCRRFVGGVQAGAPQGEPQQREG